MATIASATATAPANRKDKQMAKTYMVVAWAATLVAVQCVEATEAIVSEREHLIAAVNFVANVKSLGYILTLTDVAAGGIYFFVYVLLLFSYNDHMSI